MQNQTHNKRINNSPPSRLCWLYGARGFSSYVASFLVFKTVKIKTALASVSKSESQKEFLICAQEVNSPAPPFCCRKKFWLCDHSLLFGLGKLFYRRAHSQCVSVCLTRGLTSSLVIISSTRTQITSGCYFYFIYRFYSICRKLLSSSECCVV